MISCRELVEVLLDFVAGDLEPEHRQRVEAHLQECPPCGAYLQTYRLTIQLSRRLRLTPLPVEFEARLRALLEQTGTDLSSPNADER
ncbi:MAG: anti-sigma factor [Gemmataceae bacterium]|nr:anti-sigma factor [Gemmataceae bacterium]MDW8265199.1 zf-HC2 domain-containing protein [Gemmataceae bacterium]